MKLLYQKPNTLKKVVGLGLALTLIAGAAMPTFAQNTPAATPVPISAPVEALAAQPVAMPYTQYLYGEAVVKSPIKDGQLLVVVNDMTIALNVGKETLIVDAKTGLPGSLDKVKANDKIYVYYSPAMTKSLPPQSAAAAIAINLEEGKARPALFVVKSFESKDNQQIRVLNTAGDLIVTIGKDTPITPFKTKQIANMKDIQIGSKLFVWYEIVALSYPGQTGAQKVVLIGQNETPKLTIDGKAIDLKLTENSNAPILSEMGGQAAIQLRAASKALGYKLQWDAKTKTLQMDNGTVKTTLTVGKDSYFKASSKAIGLTQSLPLGLAPTLIDNRLYVPLSLFNLLYSNEGAVNLTLQ